MRYCSFGDRNWLIKEKAIKRTAKESGKTVYLNFKDCNFQEIEGSVKMCFYIEMFKNQYHISEFQYYLPYEYI